MQVIVVELCLGLLLFIIPKKVYKYYIYIAGIIIASLYLFLNLPREFDLYRHYEMFRMVEEYGLYGNINNALNIYESSYPVYIIILWLLSRFHIKQLLPVMVVLVSYFFVGKYLSRHLDMEKWKLTICYLVGIWGYNFLSFSGVRNILAASIFIYILYQDLVLHKNKIACLIGYVCCCGIHSVCVVYLGIRLALYVYNRLTRGMIKVGIMLMFTVIPLIYDTMYRYLEEIPFVSKALAMFYNYTHGSGAAGLKSTVYASWILYLASFVLILYFKRYGKRMNLYRQFYDFYMLSFLFTIGSYRQYDIFVRFAMILIPMIVVFLPEVFQDIQGKNLFHFKIKNNNQAGRYLFSIVVFLSGFSVYIIYLAVFRYLPITAYF